MRRPRLLAGLAVSAATVLTLGLLAPSASAASETVFGTQTPKTLIDSDNVSVTLGTTITAKVAGQITGLRFYKGGSQNNGTHTGSLFTPDGSLSVQKTFTSESASGWQATTLAAPVRVTAGGKFVAAVTMPNGRYSSTSNYTYPKSSASLTATSGVYTYGSGVRFPNSVFGSTSYFVDVVFTPDVASSPSPSPSSTATPTSGPTPSVTPSASPTPSDTPTMESPSPTPTDTTTPPTSGACVGAANTPGGADPFGGCWPGPQNTGYPHGVAGDTRTPVTLTDYTGPTTIRSCGVVINAKRIPQDLLIEAGSGTDLSKPCVTITNSLVQGVVFAEQTSYGPVLIRDSTVDPDGLSFWENVGRSNYLAERVESRDSEGVFKCDRNCVVRDSWVHGMRLGGSYHYNAAGGNGTSNFTIDHNALSCGDWVATEANTTGDAGCSAVIGFYGDYAPFTNSTINRNLLASTFDVSASGIDRQSAYCLNPGYYPGKPYGTVSNVKITDNIFKRGGSGKCGVYGPTNSIGASGLGSNTWSGNRYEDGAVINPEFG